MLLEPDWLLKNKNYVSINETGHPTDQSYMKRIELLL